MIAESEELIKKFNQWKNRMESRGTKVNMNKTNIITSISGESCKEVQNTGRWPCGVCGRGVGRNSIQCPICQVSAQKVYRYKG